MEIFLRRRSVPSSTSCRFTNLLLGRTVERRWLSQICSPRIGAGRIKHIATRIRPAQQPLTSVLIRSLRVIGQSDWVSIIEPLHRIRCTLRQDPAEAYGCMDFESRELYRNRVAFIARHSDYSESRVALTALSLPARLSISHRTTAHSSSPHPCRLLPHRQRAFSARRTSRIPPAARRTCSHLHSRSGQRRLHREHHAPQHLLHCRSALPAAAQPLDQRLGPCHCPLMLQSCKMP